MEEKKRNNATITFTDKSQKERMLQQLNSVRLQNLMKSETRGNAYKKDCQKVIWAVDKLYCLAEKGKIRVQVPMWEEPSAEKEGLLRTIDFYRAMARNLGITVDEEGQRFKEKYDNVWIRPSM